MATKLGILIETVYKGKGVKDAEKDLKGLDKATKAANTGMAKSKAGLANIALAAGAVGAALFTAKKAFDFGAEGAQVLKVRDTFDALTMSIGETSDAVLIKLRNATANMVADTDLMMSANRFLSMGLAETGDQAARLAEMSVTLGQAMGKDATAAMEEFALLLANRSIPRLDTFGISAAKVRERIAELKKEGVGIEEAFNMAVIEQGTMAMDRLGGAVPVDDFTIASVAWNNMMDDLKVGTAQALMPAIGALNDWSSKAKLARPILEALTDEIKGNVSQWEKEQIAMEKQDEIQRLVRKSAEGVVEEQAILTEVLRLLEAGVKGTAEELTGYAIAAMTATKRNDAYVDSLVAGNAATKEAIEKTKEWAVTHGRVADNVDGMADKMANRNAQLSDEEAFIRNANAANKRYFATLGDGIAVLSELTGVSGDYFVAALEAEDKTLNLADELFRAADAADADAVEMALLGGALGLYDEAALEAALQTALLMIAIDDIAAAFSAGTISAEGAKEALLGVASGAYETAGGAIAAQTEIDTAREALENIEGNWLALLEVSVDDSALDATLAKLRSIASSTSGAAGIIAGSIVAGAASSGRNGPGTSGVVHDDADFFVSGSQPAVAAFAPGDYVTASKTPPGRGDSTVINVDARGAAPGVEQSIRLAVRQELARSGQRANNISRTL